MYISKAFEVPEATPFKKHFENVSISMWFRGHENHIDINRVRRGILGILLWQL